MGLRGEFYIPPSLTGLSANVDFSVTPLKANFWHPDGFSGDLQLDC